MRKRQWKKVLSLMLALAMVFTMNTGVFAAEAGTVSEPAATEQAPVSETAPAAETPALETAEETEAPEAETPATETEAEAEAPAKEEKAEETAAEETKEAEAEEPAKAEAAAVSEAETEEPAKEAEVVEETAAPEEAAGTMDYPGMTSSEIAYGSGKLTVSYISATNGGTGTTAYVALSSDAAAGIIGVSVNYADDDTNDDGTLVLTASEGEVSINQIFVSSNDASKLTANLTKMIISGNNIVVNDTTLYVEEGSDKVLGAGNIKTDKNSVVLKSDGTVAASDGANYEEKSYVYADQDVSMSVSADAFTISFDKAVKKVLGGTSQEAIYDGAEVPANTQIDVYEKVKDTAIEDLFVQLEDGSYASLGTSKIPEKGINKAAIAGITVTENGFSGWTGSMTADWFAVTETAFESEKDIVEYIQNSGEFDWKKYSAPSDFKYSDGKPGTTYYVVLKEDNVNEFATYAAKSFTTNLEAPDKSEYEYTPDWKATWNGNNDKPVSINKTTGMLLVEGPGTSDDVEITVSSNAEGLSVNGVIISTNAAAYSGKVTVVASANEVTIDNPNVFAMVNTGATVSPEYKTLFAGKEQIILNEKETRWTNNSTDIKLANGDIIAKPIYIPEAKDGYALKFDFDKVQVSISSADLGAEILSYVKAGETVKVSENNVIKAGEAFDFDDFVGTETIVFLYSDGVYGVLGSGYHYNSATSDIIKIVEYDSKQFVINATAADTASRFAYSDEEVEGAAALKALDYSISLNESGNTEYTVSKNLTPGQKYHVFRKTASANGYFAKYEEVADVTLGVSFNVTIKPVATENFEPGDDINGTQVSYNVVEGKDTFVSGNATKASPLKVEDYVDELTAIEITNYPISYNSSFGEGTVNLDPSNESPVFKLAEAKHAYVISANVANKNNVAKNAAHNTVTVTVENGEVYVLSSDSTVAVKTENYYYGLPVSTWKSKASVVADGDHGMDIDAVTLEYGSMSGNEFVKDDTLTDEKIQTLSAGSTFAAKFKVNETVSGAVTVSVNKRPVDVSARVNYFSLQGKTASANEIAAENYDVTDFYDTAFETKAEAPYIKAGSKVTPDFTNVKVGEAATDKDLETLKNAQSYDLSYTVADAYAGTASGNYTFTGGNAKDYAYNVAPVYGVKFTGSFLSASFNGADIKAGTVKVNSDAADKITELEKEYSFKEMPVSAFDVYASFKVPTDVKVKSGNKFIGWKRYGLEVSENALQEVSDNDAEYKADIREGVPGFDTENGLMISLTDSVVYTGLKHVSDPVEQYTRAEVPGAAAAIEKTRQTAEKNSGDIDLQVYVGDTLLVENYDYTATYKNNINAYDIEANKSAANFAAKAPQVTIKFKNGYAQYPTVVKYFSITPADINDITDGTGVDSRLLKAAANNTAAKLFKKTDLVNIKTGKALKYNANEAKSDVKFAVDGDLTKAGTAQVTVTGVNNYTGDKPVEVYLIDSKVKWTTKNFAKGKPDGKNETLSYNALDTYYHNAAGIEAEIAAAVGEGAEVMTYRKKMDYAVPGTKQVTYKAYVIDTTGETPKVSAYKGSYKYKVAPVTAEQLKEMSVDWGEKTTDYVKAKATIPVDVHYNGTECMDLFKLGFSKNSKPTTEAVAKLTAAKGAYFDKDAKKALKEEPFVTKFTINKAKLADVINVWSAYVVSADGTDARKIKKTGSIILKDDMGAVLVMGKDYTLDSIADGIATVSAKSANYEGSTSFEVDYVAGYLGGATIKFGGSGFPKKVAVADIESLNAGTASENVIANRKFVEKYNIKVKGKVNGANAELTQANGDSNNFNVVVTQSAKGGSCYIQVVGVDGGLYGGSKVLAKKQITKKTE